MAVNSGGRRAEGSSTKHVFVVSSSSTAAKNRTKCQKFAICSSVLGLLFFLAGLLHLFIMEPIVESRILSNFPLREGTEMFANWKDPPVHPMLYMKFFNLTNKESFLAGLEKPMLREVGPYTYRQNINKVNIEFSPDGEEVSFEVRREYFFEPEISGGREDDVVVVPNIPLFGAMKKMAAESSFAKSMFVSLLRSYADVAADTEPFVALTVRELLWSYPSLIMSLERSQSQECSDDHGDDFFDEGGGGGDLNCDIVKGNLAPFGLMIGRNLTSLDPRTIKTGTRSLDEMGAMARWHGEAGMDYWRDVPGFPDCNRIGGNDPGNLPVGIEPTDELDVFVGQLCRKLTFFFEKAVEADGFRMLQFRSDPRTFDSPADEPKNACFCVSQNCLPTGLLDLDGCFEGSPIYMSWPHFLHGQPELLDGVEGLSPDVESHSFTLNIEPKYGIAMSALARLQMNVVIEKNGGFGLFDSISQDTIYYPFCWLEEGVPGPSKIMAGKVTYLLELPRRMKILMVFGGIGIGLLCCVPQLALLICSCRKVRRKSYVQSTYAVPEDETTAAA